MTSPGTKSSYPRPPQSLNPSTVTLKFVYPKSYRSPFVGHDMIVVCRTAIRNVQYERAASSFTPLFAYLHLITVVILTLLPLTAGRCANVHDGLSYGLSYTVNTRSSTIVADCVIISLFRLIIREGASNTVVLFCFRCCRVALGFILESTNSRFWELAPPLPVNLGVDDTPSSPAL